jgi:hypothetical protein
MAEQGGYEGFDDFDDDDSGYDFEFDDDGLEPAEGSYGGSADYGDPEGGGEALTPAEFRALVNREVDAAVGPVLEQNARWLAEVDQHETAAARAEWVEAECEQLERDFPELVSESEGDPGDLLQDAVIEMARADAAELGHPELVQDPRFVRRTLEAHRDELGQVLERAQNVAYEAHLADVHPAGRTRRAIEAWEDEQDARRTGRVGEAMQVGDSVEDRMAAAYAKSRHRVGG